MSNYYKSLCCGSSQVEIVSLSKGCFRCKECGKGCVAIPMIDKPGGVPKPSEMFEGENSSLRKAYDEATKMQTNEEIKKEWEDLVKKGDFDYYEDSSDSYDDVSNFLSSKENLIYKSYMYPESESELDAEHVADWWLNKMSEQRELKVGQLRQWLNEKDPERLVTNEDIKIWLK